jgi:microcystin-dependent protein
MFEYGQAVSRGTYSALMAAITFGQSGTLTATSPTITGISDTSQMFIGEHIEGTGIPGGTTILSLVANVSITMSAPATASVTTTVTVFPYGDGDGSTTFNLPDLRGYIVAGRDNMGGTAAGNLTATYAIGNPDSLGSDLGSQSKTVAQANLPAVSFANSGIAVANGNLTGNATQAVAGGESAFTLFPVSTANANLTTLANLTSNVTVSSQGSAASGGSGTPLSVVQPSITSNMCIKVQ